jgi:hypothetical protein
LAEERLRFHIEAERPGQRDIEMAVVDEDAVVDDRRRLQILKLSVRVEAAHAGFKAGKNAGADEHRRATCAGLLVAAGEQEDFLQFFACWP